MAVQFPVPSPPRQYRQVYDGFRGVDFSTDALKIDRSRAADSLNMISDNGGNPEKRLGWRVVHQLSGEIYAMHPVVLSGQQHVIIHAGTSLYDWNVQSDTEPTVLLDEINGARSSAFAMNGILYILTGKEYISVASAEDGEIICSNVLDNAYIPTTSISRTADGGGVSLEPVNLLQQKRINTLLGDGASTTFPLDTQDIDSIIEVQIDGVALETSEYSADLEKGTITFLKPPAKPAVSGRDNISVTFSKLLDGYSENITSCTLSTTYQQGYAFVAGNPSQPNTDWRCEYGNPSYFPDLNYHKIGNESTKIVAYLHTGDSLAVLKEPSTQEPSIYIRSGTFNQETGKMLFQLSQGVGGIGAVSHSTAVLAGDPLFITPRGIFGLAKNGYTLQDVAHERSYYIDAQLQNMDLTKAESTVWRGYYIMTVGNGLAYILDSNQTKSWHSKDGGSYGYECYKWDNIPATALTSVGDCLLFGTADGQICRFNNDLIDSTGKIRMDAYNDNGKPIQAFWATLADDDGFIGEYKTMRKRGCSVTIKPFTRSSVDIYVRTEKDFGRFIRSSTMDIFSWEDIDFERFTFSSVDSPQTVMLNSKVKKYQTAQIILKNSQLNEAFGIYKIEKVFTKGNYSKR